MIKVICQICQEEIATLRPGAAIYYPLSGSMFASIEPERGIPSPFQPDDTWELMKCPYGPHRPMVRPDQILTSEGILHVPKNGQPTFYAAARPELDRTDVFDREMDVPPAITEAQAEALVRAQMGENPLKVAVNTLGVPIRGTSLHVDGDNILIVDEKNIRLIEDKENGKADTWQGQQEDEKPIENKKEENQTDGKQDTGTAAGAFVCEKCGRGFKNLSGLNNHKRFKHK